MVAPAAEGAPSSDRGQDSGVCLSQVSWKAGRAHFVGKSDTVFQTKDSVVVVVVGVLFIVRVVDDLGNVNPGELVVGDIVLSKQYLDAGCRFIFSAMGSAEDMGGRDESSSAPRTSPIPTHYTHLPRVLMLLSLLATNNII